MHVHVAYICSSYILFTQTKLIVGKASWHRLSIIWRCRTCSEKYCSYLFGSCVFEDMKVANYFFLVHCLKLSSSSDSWCVLHTYWKEHHCSLQFILFYILGLCCMLLNKILCVCYCLVWSFCNLIIRLCNASDMNMFVYASAMSQCRCQLTGRMFFFIYQRN